MKLKCLSKGDGFYFPPSHLITIFGFQVLVDFPIDLSSLAVFSPIPTTFHQEPPFKISHLDDESPNSPPGFCKRRRIEKTLEATDLITALPWYKIVDLQHVDASLIDVVLITSPMGMLGLPFLTQSKQFSAKIYATEVGARLGWLMIEDLLCMHAEFRQFYGPEECGFPKWMEREELRILHPALQEIVMGKAGADLGSWKSLYSATDVKHCMKKVQMLKYAEEVCYNGALIIKPFSSGLDLGTCNWTINGPRRNFAYLSSSIFGSAHAMDFDYLSLKGNDVILFSDFSSLRGTEGKMTLPVNSSLASCSSALRDECNKGEQFRTPLVDNEEILDEVGKLTFISSCAVNSLEEGGSVLIPIDRLGVLLQLLEQISSSLNSLNMKAPIFIISSVAEETLAFTNIIPEWLSMQRQQKLYSGEALFAHVELMKEHKIHIYPAIGSPNLIATWKEPCVVFCPHWSLRLGPVFHLLHRWHGDPNSLLVLEEGIDAELVLLPFKPVTMKVLQCSFLSGIKIHKVAPLLEMLQPKIVLFPEDLRPRIFPHNANSNSYLFYTENETLRVPSLKENIEAELSTNLAFLLKPRRTKQNMAIARLKAELLVSHGKHMLVPAKGSANISENQLLYWGSMDPKLLLLSLQEKGLIGSIHQPEKNTDIDCVICVEGNKAAIEISKTRTVISGADETSAALIVEAVMSVLDCI